MAVTIPGLSVESGVDIGNVIDGLRDPSPGDRARDGSSIGRLSESLT
jgi:hypothetical protein